MNRAGKAAMLSGLVYPGLVQISLGQKMLGIILIVLTTGGIVGIMVGIIQKTPMIQELLQQELATNTLNMARILEISHELTYSGSTGLATISLALVLCCFGGSTQCIPRHSLSIAADIN